MGSGDPKFPGGGKHGGVISRQGALHGGDEPGFVFFSVVLSLALTRCVTSGRLFYLSEF